MSKESAYTSLNQIPAVFKNYELGSVNLDFGGGKYNKGTNYLDKHGTTNLVFDPYNRSEEHNEEVLLDSQVMYNVNSITCLNVLNVITSKKERADVLKNIRMIVKTQKNEPVVLFSIYEGNRSGVPGTRTTQTNMKTADYIPEIQKVFPEWEVQQQGNVLIV